MLQIFRKNKKGFTLIELLVVIAVIGLLSSIVLVSMGPARKKAKDTKRMTDLKQISSAMELCYGEPICNGGQDRYIATTAGVNAVTAIGTFMPKVPCDPLGCGAGYTWTANAPSPSYKYYCAYSKLEAETADTFFCASNKGVMKYTYTPGSVPSNISCCNVNVTQ